MANAQIVQSTGDNHYQVREALFGVTKGILDDPATLDTREGMFDFHTDARQFAIVSFLTGCQFLFAGLFFGWQLRGFCRKVDYNRLLSTLYCSIVYYIFQHMVWLGNFATEP